MDKKSRISLPSFLGVIIALYLYWSLWKEIAFSEILYYISIFTLFVISCFYLIGKHNFDVNVLLTVCAFTLWCVLMYVAFNISEYAYIQKKVTFFGLNMDSHSRIMLYLFFCVVPGMILSTRYRIKQGTFFKILLFIIVISSLIFSIRATIAFPDAIRARRTAAYLGYEEVLFGTPTYSIVYSMCLFVPWILAKASAALGKEKIFYYTIAICIGVTVAISQFATALLTMVSGLSVYWLFSSNQYKGVLFRGAVICIFFIALLARTPIVSGLEFLSESVSGAWSEKLKDIALFVQGDGAAGDLSTRSELYSTSWQIFFGSPFGGKLFSSDTEIIGGHSTMFDSLAMVGLVGGLFLLTSVFISYLIIKNKATTQKYFAAANAILVSYLILLFTKNILTALSVNYTFFVLMPMLFDDVEKEHDDEFFEAVDFYECDSYDWEYQEEQE